MTWTPSQIAVMLGVNTETEDDRRVLFGKIVEQQLEESSQLDLKSGDAYGPSTGGDGRGWSSEQEFAKDVTALANQNGGWLAIGIGEANHRADSLKPVNRAAAAVEETRLRTALANYAAPAPDVEFVHAVIDDGHLTIVSVPSSPRAPHAVKGARGDQRKPHYYFVRDGSDTRALEEYEIADRYRLRQVGAAALREREDRVIREGLDTLSRSDSTWTYLAIVPEYSSDVRLNSSRVREAEEWLHGFRFASPNGATLIPQGHAMAAPERTTFTDYTDTGDEAVADVPKNNYVELFPAGAFFGACTLTLHEEGDIYYAHLRDDLIQLVNYGLAWVSATSGAFGRATMIAGICRNSSKPRLTLVTQTIGPARKMARTRTIDTDPQARVLAELDRVESTQDRLRFVYLILSGIGHNFGLAEAEGLREDGSLVRDAWLYWDDISKWCEAQGVQLY